MDVCTRPNDKDRISLIQKNGKGSKREGRNHLGPLYPGLKKRTLNILVKLLARLV